jgi:hypothetical protein
MFFGVHYIMFLFHKEMSGAFCITQTSRVLCVTHFTEDYFVPVVTVLDDTVLITF